MANQLIRFDISVSGMFYLMLRLDPEDVLWISSRICMPKVGDLIRLILEESHSLRYYIHPGVAKICHDLKQYYLWCGMKRNIVGCVSICLNFQ